MTAIMLATDRMETTLDARGLACPLPAVKARGALARIPPGAALVVLATDPEAPIDVAAVAVDAGCRFEVERDGAGWRLTLQRPTCATGTRSARRATGPASAP
jgi:tRNA 2-thiouridine synthesizing protein A